MATIVDLNSAYDNAENSIKAIQTFNQVSEDNKQITSQQQSSQEKAAEETVSPLTQLQENKKKFQRQTETQLDKLLKLNQLLPDNRLSGKSSSSVVSLVKNDFLIALNQIKSELPGIIKKAMLKQLGCSQEQTYDVSTFSANGIFIPVESVDLFGLLKESPTHCGFCASTSLIATSISEKDSNRSKRLKEIRDVLADYKWSQVVC